MTLLGKVMLPSGELAPLCAVQILSMVIWESFAMRAQRGFSLVELLVVIAIIGILLSLLLPAVQAARSAARRTNCASNLRQVGLAIRGYAETHRGRFPDNAHTGQSWIYTIAPFMESVDEIRICPDDPKGPDRLKNKLTSYVMNSYLTSEPGTNEFTTYSKIKATSKTIACFELADGKAANDATSDHIHAHFWFTGNTVSHGTVLKTIESDITTSRHGDCAHYLYLDGHVERISTTQISDWAAKPFNFAKPQ